MAPTDEPPDPNQALALEALLRWYAAMGVDAAIDEIPHDRFVAPPPPSASRVAPVLAALSPARVTSGASSAAGRSAETLVAEAEALAAGAADLADLHARWAAVPGCSLAASSRMIAAHVPVGAALMLVGGTPGEDDERAGAIFSGKPGLLLDAMLRAIGLARSDVALAHVVPWRPPGGRVPSPLELSLCLPFARRQIALTGPQVLLCLGERAAQPLLGTRDTLLRLRGRWFDYEGETVTVKTLATYAPDFLLKQPLHKRRAWGDLLMLEAELESLGPRQP